MTDQAISYLRKGSAGHPPADSPASAADLQTTRRGIFAGAACVAATAMLPTATFAQAVTSPLAQTSIRSSKVVGSGYIETEPGVEIFYKDWGPKDAQPIMFHHGWPLSADQWDNQMLFFLAHGYRVVATDRRGDGRSTQTDTGNDMDHYASDASAVVENLDLRNVIQIGHSTGGGVVARYVARFGKPQRRVAKVVLVSSVPPLMLKTENNPDGTPIAVFNGYREALEKDRAQFYLDVASGPFYGFNLKGAKVLQGVIQNWWRQAMMGSALAQYQCIKAFSDTNQTDDLKAITVPTLILQGTGDQVVPYKDASLLQHELIKNSTLKLYPEWPHGMWTIHPDVIDAEVLAFIKG